MSAATIFNAQELHFEDDISRNPYNLKSWLSYLTFMKGAKSAKRYMIYERALKHLPRSYKLWFAYLMERVEGMKERKVDDSRGTILTNTFERALVQMNKMPRIWKEYCKHLISIKKGTETRKAFDRALQSLPITQHKDLWELYIDWAKEFGVAETTVRVFRRYLMYDASKREHFVTYLESIGQVGEAALQLAVCVNDEHYLSPTGASKHQLWMRLCDMCAAHPDAVSSNLKVESIIRSGIARFSDEVGRLWCKLADFYVRQGQFEKSRDIYEEALSSVTTVKDFSIVFDAYVRVEEGVLSAKLRGDDDDDDGDDEDDDDEDGALGDDTEMRLARLEYLLEKRPILLNSVVLRQNPNNVFEWHKRVKLFKGDTKLTLIAYMEGVKTVDPKYATGKLNGLWISFAKFYEKSGDLDSARTVFQRAVKVNFKSVEELANVWCGWGEMEMRHEEYDAALQVMQQAVAEPTATARRRKQEAQKMGKGMSESEIQADSVVQDRVHRNVKIWALYLDLEESLGTVDTCRAAYERVIDLKVATAQMCLNYASYLEEHDYFEDSFRVYEKAVSMYTFPQLKIIWLTYLDKFMARYSGTKLERLRDLFEQSLTEAPEDCAAELYMKYGKAEEEYGLARHAMAVYDRACRAVPEARRLDMYRLYIRKVEQYFGVTKTRPIYERAISELSDDQSRQICVEFADMERKLGEVDRARAIWQHGSQFADPRKEPQYWARWKSFEEAHGNEDTFRDMLRVQRSVEAAFSQVNYLAAEMLAGTGGDAPEAGLGVGAAAPVGGLDSMAMQAEQSAIARAQEQEASMESNKRKFVKASDQENFEPSKRAALTDTEEIDIDGEGEGEEGERPAPMDFSQKPVPAAVFGSLESS